VQLVARGDLLFGGVRADLGPHNLEGGRRVDLVLAALGTPEVVRIRRDLAEERLAELQLNVRLRAARARELPSARERDSEQWTRARTRARASNRRAYGAVGSAESSTDGLSCWSQ
jgi:hypothetical protein